MSVGIDTNICKKVKCQYFEGGFLIDSCKRIENPKNKWSLPLMFNDVEIPNNCPYKNIHITAGDNIIKDKEICQ